MRTTLEPLLTDGVAARVAIRRSGRLLSSDTRLRDVLFINGEAVRVRGRDGALLKQLADDRALDARDIRAQAMP